MNRVIAAEKRRAKTDEIVFLFGTLSDLISSPSLSPKDLALWPTDDLKAVVSAWAAWPHGLDRPLSEGDLAKAFAAAFDAYISDIKASTRETLRTVTDSLRRNHEQVLRMMGPFAEMRRFAETISLQRSAWYEDLARAVATKRSLGLDQFAMVESARTHARLITDLTATVRMNPALSGLTPALSGISDAIRASAGHQTLIQSIAESALRFSPAAARLHVGLQSLTSSATAVLDDWASGVEPPVFSDRLVRGPTTEVTFASAVSAAIVGGEVEEASLEDDAVDLEELLDRELTRLQPALVSMYNGAKDVLRRTGSPDQGRHLAVSLRELFTHTLHILAPDHEVTAWPETTADDIVNGRPTRRLRVRYIYRNLPPTSYGAFIADDIKRVLDLMDLLNSDTHRLDLGTTRQVLRLTLRRAQGTLALLLEAAKSQ